MYGTRGTVGDHQPLWIDDPGRVSASLRKDSELAEFRTPVQLGHEQDATI